MSFRSPQIDLLAGSGWARCASVARTVAAAGLPAVTREYLEVAFTPAHWLAADRATRALSERFAGARFAADVDYGVLLVPDPAKLDTRAPVHPETRCDQVGAPTPDVYDEHLPTGALSVPGGRDWTMVVTVTSASGVSLGSHLDVTGADADRFTVEGVDTRALMTRQLWGARVLQRGSDPPDCEVRRPWTFTLFPGEPLTDGLAESGTVLKGKVRFRLGRADRGIGPARVAPAVAVDELLHPDITSSPQETR